MRRAHRFVLEHKEWIIPLTLFLFTFVLFTYLLANDSFADPDSFYHMKMAMLIRDEGIIKGFPWLPFTVLRDIFIDQHFLYHVLLIPFVTFLQPMVGAKLVAALLGSAVALTFYMLLRKERVRFAYPLSILLFLITPFTFRIALVKAPSVSVLLLLLGIFFIFRKKYAWLFILSFLYVWAYGGFIVLPMFAALYACVVFFRNMWKRSGMRHHSIPHRLVSSEVAAVLFSVFGGTIVGLVINPFFPENLAFYWNQLVKIGIVNYQNVIGVGNEWYPYKFIELMSSTVLLSILLSITLILFVVSLRRQTVKSISLFLLAVIFFAFTLKSRRYIEYYVPFTLLFCAFALDRALSTVDWKNLWRSVTEFYVRRKVFATVLAVYFLVSIPTIILRDLHATKQDLGRWFPYTRFQQASEWMKDHSSEGEIVFHSSWDEFPMLFYYNSHNAYIVGLDPTFLYEADKNRHKKVVDITTGQQASNLHADIRGLFNARFVFIEKSHALMRQNIEASEGFLKAYEDNEATVYIVKD